MSTLKNICLLVFGILGFSSCQQSLSSWDVNEAKNRIQLETCLYTAAESPNYNFLKRVATNDDLVVLCEAENAFVQYYAYSILAERKYPHLKEIYEANRYNTKKIPFDNSACLSGVYQVNQEMLFALHPDNEFGYSKEEYEQEQEMVFGR